MRIDTKELHDLTALAERPEPAEHGTVAREFEAMLLAEVWKDALSSGETQTLLGGGSADRMYREMFVDEVVRRMAGARGFGLAERLTDSMQNTASSPAADEERERDDG